MVGMFTAAALADDREKREFGDKLRGGFFAILLILCKID
jgi:hypothetical protein